jgi:hypothetical protein
VSLVSNCCVHLSGGVRLLLYCCPVIVLFLSFVDRACHAVLSCCAVFVCLFSIDLFSICSLSVHPWHFSYSCDLLCVCAVLCNFLEWFFLASIFVMLSDFTMFLMLEPL